MLTPIEYKYQRKYSCRNWIIYKLAIQEIGKMFVIFFISLVLSCNALKTHTVKTNAGIVKGFETNMRFNGLNYKVRKYLGIPYAEAPVGDLRLRKPVPLKTNYSNSNFIDATKLREICIQSKENENVAVNFQESEDCLFINVYSPFHKIVDTPKKAVMVWIHDGYGSDNFGNGGANFVSGDVLSSVGDVIVVTFNYRLSLFGFFSLADGYTEGNYGLWDQRLAIQWVHDNIGFFGGDPNRVTLFGKGQGAVSAILQTLYDGNNVFQGVIAHTGTAFGSFENGKSAFITEGTDVNEISKALSCDNDDTHEISQCVREMDVEILKTGLTSTFFQNNTPFTPSVDLEFIKSRPDIIIEDLAWNNASSVLFSNVKLMIGFEENQKLPKLGRLTTPKIIKRNIYKELHKVYGSKLPDIVMSAIVNRYTDLNKPNDKNVMQENALRFNNDIHYLIPSIRTALVHSQNRNEFSNTYLYKTSICSETQGHNVSQTEIYHDTFHIFGYSKNMMKSHMSTFKPSVSDLGASNKLMQWWTNFAKHGNPNPIDEEEIDQQTVWRNFNKSSPSYIILPSLEEVYLSDEPSVAFWMDIVPFLLRSAYNTIPMNRNTELINYRRPLSVESVGKTKKKSTDISIEDANSVIIALAAIVGFLCLILVILGVMIMVVKVRRTLATNTDS